MPTWILYGLAALAIVTAIGGGYLMINNMISSRDKIIANQQATITAQQLDINRLEIADEANKKTIARQKQDLISSQAQANRIKQVDAEERQRQNDFNRKVQGLNVRDQINLDKINLYQQCISRDVNDTECGKLLQ